MKNAIAMAVLCLGMALTGCSNTGCDSACNTLDSCALQSSGFSCDPNCALPLQKCAVCINVTKCQDIASSCADTCPGVTFTRQ
jgi:hypothetical protein